MPAKQPAFTCWTYTLEQDMKHVQIGYKDNKNEVTDPHRMEK